eukprot:TRINITY_DN4508_c2_g4_i1.p1 TRINITY_DN4508_c2_g4~~TRINITY_DN4508_c2_g4_i1.p1  ORF type:complete len:410 (+),score=41.11 TRINITY_DN4508_c2_g4_i1:66-1295(+)
MSHRRPSLQQRCFKNDLPDWPSDRFVRDGALTEESAAEVRKWIQMCVESIQKADLRRANETVYTGAPGIAHVLLALTQAGHIQREQGTAAAQQMLSMHERWHAKAAQQQPDISPSLQCGPCGYHFTTAAYHKAVGDEQRCAASLRELSQCAEVSLQPQSRTPDEWLYGRAGLLFALLQAQRSYGADFGSLISRVADVIVRHGQAYAKDCGTSCPLMWQWYGTEYLGAAHGVMGIVYMLLHVPSALSAYGSELKRTVDWILSKRGSNGNYPAARGDADADLIHFCHGAPGAVYLLAKAHEIWPDQSYDRAALDAAEVVWTYGLLQKGPGICHGMGGTGFVMLRAHRLSSDGKWLHRAFAVAQFIYSTQGQTVYNRPDNPLSLYEGVGGTALFLAGILSPPTSAFPLFELV